MIETDYDRINERYVGTEYGDMRRERKRLMEQMIFRNDDSLKPRIREITLQMQEHIQSSTRTGRTSAKNPATSNCPSTK
jgi:hypothetical protein